MFFLLIVFITCITAVALYNRIVRRKYEMNKLFESTYNLHKERYQLIPVLMPLLNTHMDVEKAMNTDIKSWRQQVLSRNTNIDEKIIANNHLDESLNTLLTAASGYPALRSDTDFLALESSWNGLATRISDSKQAYNQAVDVYNRSLSYFPTNLIVEIFKIHPKIKFEI